MPKSVEDAATMIWFMILITLITTLLDGIIGSLPNWKFPSTLYFYGLAALLPYKISKASNLARYLWVALCIVGIPFIIGDPRTELGFLSPTVDYATIPISILTVYWLFSSESNNWFNKSHHA